VTIITLAGGDTICATRRRSASRRRQREQRDRQRLPDNVVSHLKLDRWLSDHFVRKHPHRSPELLRIARTPMRPGNSTKFLNRVALTYPDESKVELVEKGVDCGSIELSCWRNAGRAQPDLHVEKYTAVKPVGIIDGEPLSAIYFQYLPALDRDITVLRRDFRANICAIVAAVAKLNGRNLIRDPARSPAEPCRSPPRGPAELISSADSACPEVPPRPCSIRGRKPTTRG
jgi:hypothetical protein